MNYAAVLVEGDISQAHYRYSIIIIHSLLRFLCLSAALLSRVICIARALKYPLPPPPPEKKILNSCPWKDDSSTDRLAKKKSNSDAFVFFSILSLLLLFCFILTLHLLLIPYQHVIVSHLDKTWTKQFDTRSFRNFVRKK